MLMPIYEFICLDCNHIFSELRRMGDTENAQCPKCKSTNTKKKFSTFANNVSCSSSGGG